MKTFFCDILIRDLIIRILASFQNFRILILQDIAWAISITSRLNETRCCYFRDIHILTMRKHI